MKTRRTIPDQGYAWMILLATFLTNYLSGVLVYFVGIIHVELLGKYKDDVTTTSWAGAVYSSNSMLTAPLASWFIQRYNCRVSVIVGGLCLFVGFLCSAFATSIIQIIFTYGIVAGVGIGLVYTPTLMIVTFYFDKYRAMASGLSVSGYAVGILSGSLMTQAAIEEYGLTGAFMLIGVTSLNNLVFGALYRPTHHEGKGSSAEREEEPSPELGRELQKTFYVGDNDDSCEKKLLPATGEEDPVENGLAASGDAACLDSRQTALNETLEAACLHSKETTPGDASGESHESKQNAAKVEAEQERTVVEEHARDTKTASARHECDDAEKEGLLNERGERQHAQALNAASARAEHSPGRTRAAALRSRVRDTFRDVVPLLKNAAFVSHCGHALCSGMNMSGVFIHLPEYVILLGTAPTEAAALFVGVGLLSIASRLLTGLFVTSFGADPLVVSVALMGGCGVATSLFPLYSATYLGQMTFSCLFGLTTGGYYTLINVLTVHLVEFHLLPPAYGVLLFCMGVGYVVGPPIAAMIVDAGGSYEHSFIFLGLAAFSSAAFDLLAKLIHRRKTKNQSNKQIKSSSVT